MTIIYLIYIYIYMQLVSLSCAYTMSRYIYIYINTIVLKHEFTPRRHPEIGFSYLAGGGHGLLVCSRRSQDACVSQATTWETLSHSTRIYIYIQYIYKCVCMYIYIYMYMYIHIRMCVCIHSICTQMCIWTKSLMSHYGLIPSTISK